MEVVSEYKYLGQIVSMNDGQAKENHARISASWRSFWALKHLFKSEMSNYHKRKLMDWCVLPVLTYGAQTWSLTKAQEHQLAVAQRAMERSMLKIRLQDRIRNEEIRKTTKIKDVVEKIKELKWSWAGHLARREDCRWSHLVINWIPENGFRSRGRPRTRWHDEIKEFAGDDWSNQAQDREKWKKMGLSFVQQWTVID